MTVTIPNITPWRRQTFGDLTSAFGFPEFPAATTSTVLDTISLGSGTAVIDGVPIAIVFTKV